MDKDTSESWQELLDTRFYFERMVVVLLHIQCQMYLPAVSIYLYRTVVNTKIKLLRKEP